MYPSLSIPLVACLLRVSEMVVVDIAHVRDG